ncbi:MAG: hypothetical protein NTX75_17740 [Proteobacteria bacterium]|nr:hypothetical protein [Pseudomonadota bacterium]
MTEQEKSGSPEFMYLPLEDIIVEEQIRSSIDTESESFKSLMESIVGAHVTPSTGKANGATPSRS